MTGIIRLSTWTHFTGGGGGGGGVATDYKKDFFRNKVFGSVEKLDRQFGNNDDEGEEGEDEKG